MQQIETSDRKHTVRLTGAETDLCASEIKFYRLNLILIWLKLTDSCTCNKYLSVNQDPEVVVVFRLELKLLKTTNLRLGFCGFLPNKPINSPIRFHSRTSGVDWLRWRSSSPPDRLGHFYKPLYATGKTLPDNYRLLNSAPVLCCRKSASPALLLALSSSNIQSLLIKKQTIVWQFFWCMCLFAG